MLVIFWSPNVLIACPTCKDSLHENGAATGYAISILFMMSMPLLIMVFWLVLIWRLRSNRVPQQQLEALVRDKV